MLNDKLYYLPREIACDVSMKELYKRHLCDYYLTNIEEKDETDQNNLDCLCINMSFI